MKRSTNKTGNKILRFAVSSALAAAPLAGCGGQESGPTVNEPAPEPEPTHVNEPEPVEEPEYVNEREPEEAEQIHVNEIRPPDIHVNEAPPVED